MNPYILTMIPTLIVLSILCSIGLFFYDLPFWLDLTLWWALVCSAFLLVYVFVMKDEKDDD